MPVPPTAGIVTGRSPPHPAAGNAFPDIRGELEGILSLSFPSDVSANRKLSVAPMPAWVNASCFFLFNPLDARSPESWCSNLIAPRLCYRNPGFSVSPPDHVTYDDDITTALITGTNTCAPLSSYP
jgi:hypothetical protein